MKLRAAQTAAGGDKFTLFRLRKTAEIANLIPRMYTQSLQRMGTQGRTWPYVVPDESTIPERKDVPPSNAGGCKPTAW